MAELGGLEFGFRKRREGELCGVRGRREAAWLVFADCGDGIEGIAVE
jgi:hypothetical protein